MSIEYLNKICGNPYYAEPTIPYVGTDIPLSGSYIKQRLQVDNAAVPGGRSEIWWTGVRWEPPPGELIFSNMSPSSAVISATSLAAGVRVAIASYDMPPEYMWPNLRPLWLRASFVSNDQASTAVQYLGVTVTSEALPASADFNNRIISRMGNAAAAYYTGIPASVSRQFVRNGSNIYASEIGNTNHIPGDASAAIGWPGRTVGVYAPGSTKIVLDVNPGATTNVFRHYGVEIYA